MYKLKCEKYLTHSELGELDLLKIKKDLLDLDFEYAPSSKRRDEVISDIIIVSKRINELLERE